MFSGYGIPMYGILPSGGAAASLGGFHHHLQRSGAARHCGHGATAAGAMVLDWSRGCEDFQRFFMPRYAKNQR